MSRSSTSIFCCSRKLLALRQVVHVGFQKKVGLAMGGFYPCSPDLKVGPTGAAVVEPDLQERRL